MAYLATIRIKGANTRIGMQKQAQLQSKHSHCPCVGFPSFLGFAMRSPCCNEIRKAMLRFSQNFQLSFTPSIEAFVCFKDALNLSDK